MAGGAQLWREEHMYAGRSIAMSIGIAYGVCLGVSGGA
jgi:hypothetical protein